MRSEPGRNHAASPESRSSSVPRPPRATRELIARGGGEVLGLQRQVALLMRTEEEGVPSPRRVFDIEGVTRGLGLDRAQELQVQRMVEDTSAEFRGQQRLVQARQRLHEALRAMGLDGSLRMELSKRATAYWRHKYPTENTRSPEIRVSKSMVMPAELSAHHLQVLKSYFPTIAAWTYAEGAIALHTLEGLGYIRRVDAIAKAAGHKYKRRWRGPDGRWVYEYDEKPSPKQRRKAAEATRAQLDLFGRPVAPPKEAPKRVAPEVPVPTEQKLHVEEQAEPPAPLGTAAAKPMNSLEERVELLRMRRAAAEGRVEMPPKLAAHLDLLASMPPEERGPLIRRLHAIVMKEWAKTDWSRVDGPRTVHTDARGKTWTLTDDRPDNYMEIADRFAQAKKILMQRIAAIGLWADVKPLPEASIESRLAAARTVVSALNLPPEIKVSIIPAAKSSPSLGQQYEVEIRAPRSATKHRQAVARALKTQLGAVVTNRDYRELRTGQTATSQGWRAGEIATLNFWPQALHPDIEPTGIDAASYLSGEAEARVTAVETQAIEEPASESEDNFETMPDAVSEPAATPGASEAGEPRRAQPPVDASLWTLGFGPGGGRGYNQAPSIPELTEEGRMRAAKVAANMPEAGIRALEELSALGGEAALESKVGSRIYLSPFGQDHGFGLRELTSRGLAELVPGEEGRAYRLTEQGRQMIERVNAERDSLLQRVNRSRENNFETMPAPAVPVPVSRDFSADFIARLTQDFGATDAEASPTQISFGLSTMVDSALASFRPTLATVKNLRDLAAYIDSIGQHPGHKLFADHLRTRAANTEAAIKRADDAATVAQVRSSEDAARFNPYGGDGPVREGAIDDWRAGLAETSNSRALERAIQGVTDFLRRVLAMETPAEWQSASSTLLQMKTALADHAQRLGTHPASADQRNDIARQQQRITQALDVLGKKQAKQAEKEFQAKVREAKKKREEEAKPQASEPGWDRMPEGEKKPAGGGELIRYDLPDHYTSIAREHGIKDTLADVSGPSRIALHGTIEQWQSMLAELRTMHASAKGGDKRSLTVAIRNLENLTTPKPRRKGSSPQAAAPTPAEPAPTGRVSTAEAARIAAQAVDAHFAELDRQRAQSVEVEVGGKAPPGGWTDADRVPDATRQRVRDEARAFAREQRMRLELGKRIVLPEPGAKLVLDGKSYTVVSAREDDRQQRIELSPDGGRAKMNRQLIVWPGGALNIWTPGASGSRPEQVESFEGFDYTAEVNPFHARAEAAKAKRVEEKKKREEEEAQRKYEDEQRKKREKAEERARIAEERAAAREKERIAATRKDVPSGTPRAVANEEADRMRAEREKYGERASKFESFGRKQPGSAKHLAAFRDVESALTSVDADLLFTRENLERAAPPTIGARIADGLVDPLYGLTLHFTGKAFPPKPTPFRGIPMEDNRRGYYAAFEALHRALAEAQADSADVRLWPRNIAERILGAMGPNASPEDRARREYLRQVVNALNGRGKQSVLGRMGAFAEALNKAYPDKGDRTPTTVRAHALDVVDGVSIPKTFGQSAKRKGYTFDRAAAYETDVMRRKGPPSRVEGATAEATGRNAERLLKAATAEGQLGGVDYGNWVTDEERAHHLKAFVDSMDDMLDVMGMPPGMIGYNGRLGVAFGARGMQGALAHFEPGANIINLTRLKGAGSLAHEWGHFFDFAVGKVVEHPAGLSAVTAPKGSVQEAAAALMASPAMADYMARLGTVLADERFDDRERMYWKSRDEVFARCFERHIQRSLEKQGRENTYLVATKKSVAGSNGLWPMNAEVDAMAPLFEQLFSAFRSSDALQKALNTMNKGAARGGKYYRRVPRAGGGYRYFYNRADYERAHGEQVHLHGAEERRRRLVAKRKKLVVPLHKSEKPSGGGWHPIPGGKHGGMRRRKGKGYEYWYPDAGKPQLGFDFTAKPSVAPPPPKPEPATAPPPAEPTKPVLPTAPPPTAEAAAPPALPVPKEITRRSRGRSDPGYRVGQVLQVDGHWVTVLRSRKVRDYGNDDEWHVIATVRPATPEEREPAAAAREARTARKETLLAVADKIQRTGASADEKFPKGFRSVTPTDADGGIIWSRLAGHRLIGLDEDGVAWLTQSSYDDEPRAWKLDDPEVRAKIEALLAPPRPAAPAPKPAAPAATEAKPAEAAKEPEAKPDLPADPEARIAGIEWPRNITVKRWQKGSMPPRYYVRHAYGDLGYFEIHASGKRIANRLKVPDGLYGSRYRQLDDAVDRVVELANGALGKSLAKRKKLVMPRG